MAPQSHAIEPKYPGAFETLIDLTACWDETALHRSRENVVALSQSCSRCHDHCCRFLSAAGSLAGDTYRIALDCVKTEKLSAYCRRLSEKEFRPLKTGPGRERVRFLSAVTNKGILPFTDTAKQLARRVYLVNDDYGAVSRLLLHTVRSNALAAGYDVVSCYCPLAPYDKLEHIFVPALSLGFLTSNYFHNYNTDIDPYRIINSQRFTDTDVLKAGKKRIQFNKKASAQMILQAQHLLEDAKSLHDELEGYYIHATDFTAVNALTDKVLEKLRT